MKKKIVFYGNVQLAVIGRALTQDLKFNESYEVIKASDHNLNSTWKEWPDFVICPSTYLPNKKNEGFTQDVIDSIQAAMDDADIIVCQNFKKDIKKRPTECTTEYIHDKYSKEKQVVCLPILYFSGYLNETYPNSKAVMPYVFMWLMEKGYSNNQILDWLKNEYEPKFANLIEHAANKSINHNTKRQEQESLKFNNYINTCDILSEYKDSLIVSSMNYPTSYYYGKLCKKITQVLDPDLSFESDLNKNIFPNQSDIPNFFEFKFFRETFPNLKIGDLYYEKTLTNFMRPLNIELVDEQVSIAKEIKNQNHNLPPDIQEYLDILNS